MVSFSTESAQFTGLRTLIFFFFEKSLMWLVLFYGCYFISCSLAIPCSNISYLATIEALPRCVCVCVWGRGGGGYLFPCFPEKKIGIFPCSPKSKSWLSMFPVSQNCLYSPVPFSFRLLFPCSPEINDLILLFPKILGRVSLYTWKKYRNRKVRCRLCCTCIFNLQPI